MSEICTPPAWSELWGIWIGPSPSNVWHKVFEKGMICVGQIKYTILLQVSASCKENVMLYHALCHVRQHAAAVMDINMLRIVGLCRCRSQWLDRVHYIPFFLSKQDRPWTSANKFNNIKLIYKLILLHHIFIILNGDNLHNPK